jgi:integrase
MAVQKLTQKTVDAQRWDGKTRFIRDTRATGLILAVNKTSKTYKVQRDMWRDKRVKTVRVTLGNADEVSLDEARTRAQEVVSQIKRGIDPNAPPERPPVASLTVGELWAMYEERLRDLGRAERTIESFKRHLDKYLSEWRNLSLSELRKSTCRERHERITRRNGKYPANQAMRSVRAAYNYALKQDDHDTLHANPVGGVDFHPERRREAIILPDDLPEWWRRVGALPNPLRTIMHRLGLLSGLRPGTLVSIEREWIDLDARTITIPRMKSGRAFTLPLSGSMVDFVREALRAGDVMYSGSLWLFPTRSNDGREAIATRVWRERSMPSETGHILRHTYRTMAEGIGLPQSRARALLDHKAPGIEAHYVHSSALMAELMVDQERMSRHILETANANA